MKLRIITSILTALVALTLSAAVKPASNNARFEGDRCYSFGDYATALKYYQRAYDLDHTNIRAITRMAMMHKRGLGVDRDYTKAMDWYRCAADMGDGSATFNVGLLYLSGDGVDQSYDEAIRWFCKASEQGCADAEYQMGSLYFAGRGVPQDYRIALEWYEKAAERRYLDALVNIGYMCSNGLGCVKDPAIGLQWYLHAAKYGNVVAMRNAGACFMRGEGVDTDTEEGLNWYRKAAAKGDTYSIDFLKSIGKYEETTAPTEEEILPSDEIIEALPALPQPSLPAEQG